MSSSLERQWEVSISTFENEMRSLFWDFFESLQYIQISFLWAGSRISKRLSRFGSFFSSISKRLVYESWEVWLHHLLSYYTWKFNSSHLEPENLSKESTLPTTIFHWLCQTLGVYGVFWGVSCGGAFKKLAWAEPVPLVRPFWRVFQERFWPLLVLHSSPKLFDFAAFCAAVITSQLTPLMSLPEKIRTNNKELWTPMFPYCI